MTDPLTSVSIGSRRTALTGALGLNGTYFGALKGIRESAKMAIEANSPGREGVGHAD